MIEKNNILYNDSLRKNPFAAPKGYFDTMEDNLRAAVLKTEHQAAEPTKQWALFKPAFTLALMFCLIFGMGYGILHLTNSVIGTESVEYAEELNIWQPIHVEYISELDTENENIENEEIDEDEIFEYFTSDRFSQIYMYHYLASNEK